MQKLDYIYNATILSAYDGDTLKVMIDLGLGVFHKTAVRLGGIDTPEMRGGTPESKAAAVLARDFTRKFVGEEAVVVTLKDKTGKYGRYVAIVYPSSGGGKSLNDLLVDAGHAVIKRW